MQKLDHSGPAAESSAARLDGPSLSIFQRSADFVKKSTNSPLRPSRGQLD